MLEKSVPGIPGEDYPIYAEVPETAFACDGQVDGGYYADPEADCQVFHICTADGQGGLAKYSFLCPNGTVFNQNYFICDWWFNFDCAEAEALYSLNEDIAAEREANSQSGAADEPQSGYGAATAADYEYAEYDVAPVTEAPLNTYAAEEIPAEAPPAEGYGAPGGEAPVDTYDATREGRNFRGQSQRAGRNFRGRSNGRRQNNRNNRRRPGQGRRNQGRRFRG
jgi:syndecan 1